MASQGRGPQVNGSHSFHLGTPLLRVSCSRLFVSGSPPFLGIVLGCLLCRSNERNISNSSDRSHPSGGLHPSFGVPCLAGVQGPSNSGNRPSRANDSLLSPGCL